MTRILMSICLVFLFGLVQASQVYVLDLTIYKNDTVGLNRFSIQSGGQGDFPQVGDYKYEFRIISRGATLLSTQPFLLGFVTYPFNEPDSSAPDVVNTTRMRYDWVLPYYKDAAFIQLFHDDRKIFEYELPEQVTEESGLPEKPEEKPLDTTIIICAVGGIAILALAAYGLFRYAKRGGQR